MGKRASGAGARPKRIVGALMGIACMGVFATVHATSTVVAKVGRHELHKKEVHKRLAQVPLFQLKNMGNTPAELRSNFVQELVELEVMIQGARLQHLDERPEVSERIRSVMVSALLDDLAEEAARDGVISDDKVREFYEKNAERYQSQERIRIWQIAVKTKAEAEKLIETIRSGAEFKDEASFVPAWEKLARENSIDKSTAMRRGDLGFVQPDGSTKHKDVRVPKALFDAAAKIKDGDVLTVPLQVESFWVVVARRGSIMTPQRTLASEKKNIRGFLAREYVLARRKALIASLREGHMHEKNERVLDQLTVSDNEITVSRRPGALREARSPRGSVKPVGKPGNLR